MGLSLMEKLLVKIAVLRRAGRAGREVGHRRRDAVDRRVVRDERRHRVDEVAERAQPHAVRVDRALDVRARGQLVDATYGRRTRAVIIMDNGYVILSALQPETLAGRAEKQEGGADLEITET